MKHIRFVSVARGVADGMRRGEPSPDFADAKSDLLNAIRRAVQDFIFAKKNSVV